MKPRVRHQRLTGEGVKCWLLGSHIVHQNCGYHFSDGNNEHHQVITSAKIALETTATHV